MTSTHSTSGIRREVMPQRADLDCGRCFHMIRPREHYGVVGPRAHHRVVWASSTRLCEACVAVVEARVAQ